VQDAHRFGIVHEILAPQRLLPRAEEIAGTLASKPIQSLRYSRLLFTQPIKESFQRDLAFGFALEGLSLGALPAAPIKSAGAR
jgi:enoyl-CoA hydratase/carnithine racemase